MTFTPDEHLQYLAAFMAADAAVGGPDQHIGTLAPLLAGLPLTERIWRCGCYASVYNVPAAESIWCAFDAERALRHPEDIEPWLVRNWSYIKLRRERRPVRTPTKLAACIASYRKWMEGHPERADFWHDPDGYEAAWASVGSVWSFGRYISIKLLEALGRHCDGAFRLTDLRPRDSDSPQITLSWIYPEEATALLAGHTRTTEQAIDSSGKRLMADLSTRFDLRPSWFALQVGLCEFKTAYVKRRQYPGRTLDTELRYWQDARQIGHDARFLQARGEVFPHVALAEQNGWAWNGERKVLSGLLRDHRIVWSDVAFDYVNTYNFAEPCLR